MYNGNYGYVVEIDGKRMVFASETEYLDYITY